MIWGFKLKVYALELPRNFDGSSFGQAMEAFWNALLGESFNDRTHSSASFRLKPASWPP
jgi:hypothetical protein